ncbi:hypothetical protein PENSPDRAFT_656775 [Peniophora sp. CONT]|nr:hypothetical protein PENSPDRAFT_656775 [Peniophora sp. CONT]
MSSPNRRMSMSSPNINPRSLSPTLPRLVVAPNDDSEEWIASWTNTHVEELIDGAVVEVDADTTVEEACELLLSHDVPSLVVKAPEDSLNGPYLGLFDFADVNAFLTSAATRHTYTPEYIAENPRVARVLEAAKTGRVPVGIVSNLSGKNSLHELAADANIIDLLKIFCTGAHRVLIKSPPGTAGTRTGMVSDIRLLAYFASFARPSPSVPPSPISPVPRQVRSPNSPSVSSSTTFQRYLGNALHALPLPSLDLGSEVVSLRSSDSVLDAMKRMNDAGVSSVAVMDDDTGSLQSAVSVTDIGRVLVPNQIKEALTAPLHTLITHIRYPYGETDGAERYPVYSVLSSSTLSYTIQKLLATGAHRAFVTSDPETSPSPSASTTGNLTGVVSIVDILALFARLANISDVDSQRVQRHRRASSASSQNSSFGMSSESRRRGSAGSGGLGRNGSLRL